MQLTAGSADDGPFPRLQALRSGTDEYNQVVASFVAGMQKEAGAVSLNPTNASSSSAAAAAAAAEAEEEGLRPVTVSSVQKILLPSSRTEAFAEAIKELQAARGGDGNVRMAWHGAPRIALNRIVNDGFALSLASRNGRLYGDGIYLAPERRAYTSAEFAMADNEGRKHMLLCEVALGSVEAVPFGSSQRRPSSLRFDTGADNVANPSRYVVWEEDVNDLVFPTHLVSFRYC